MGENNNKPIGPRGGFREIIGFAAIHFQQKKNPYGVRRSGKHALASPSGLTTRIIRI